MRHRFVTPQSRSDRSLSGAQEHVGRPTEPPMCDHRRTRCVRYRFLVAGFHPRADPPSPFFATMAACPDPCRPTSFSRSRSWGLGSRLDGRCCRSRSPHDNIERRSRTEPPPLYRRYEVAETTRVRTVCDRSHRDGGSDHTRDHEQRTRPFAHDCRPGPTGVPIEAEYSSRRRDSTSTLLTSSLVAITEPWHTPADSNETVAKTIAR